MRGQAPTGGTGLVGFSGTGNSIARSMTGVYGQANQGTSGVGVRGHSTSGIGMYASAGSTGTGLRVDGRVRLTNCAGVVTIASGTNAASVSPGIDLTSSSAVVATLLGDAGGSTTVKRVAIDTVANTFSIVLTANSTATVKIAWHVFG